MTIDQLEYIINLSETLNFSETAKIMHITQPALSQSVNAIENQLNIKLFNRSRHSMVITYEGELFVETARKMISLYKNYQVQLQEIEDFNRGRLTIGVPNFRGKIILEKTLPRFMKEYPNIEVKIIENSSSALEQLTAKYKTDITLINLPLNEMNVDYIPIAKEKLLLAIPKSFDICRQKKIKTPQHHNHLPSLTLKEVKDLPVIALRNEHRIRQSMNQIYASAGIKPNIVLEVNNLLTAQELVNRGLGISIFGEESIYDVSALDINTLYFRSPDITLNWTLVAAYPKGTELSRIARKYLQIAQEELGR